MKAMVRGSNNPHVHFREGDMIEIIFPYLASHVGYVTCMGNTPELIDRPERVTKYRDDLLRLRDKYKLEHFQPVVTVMMTRDSTPKIIEDSVKAGAGAVKDIPGQTSTGSGEKGVSLFEQHKYYDCAKAAGNCGVPYLKHWELAYTIDGQEIDELDREHKAIPFVEDMIKNVPDTTIVIEHISTDRLACLVETAPSNIFGSIAIQHMVYTCHPDFKYSLPDLSYRYNWLNYCKPVLKHHDDQEKLIACTTAENNTKFFAITDAAPWYLQQKLKDHKPGIFTPNNVWIPMVWEIFWYNLIRKEWPKEIIRRYNRFMSEISAEAYNWPLNDWELTLQEDIWTVPGLKDVPVFWEGKDVNWVIQDK